MKTKNRLNLKKVCCFLTMVLAGVASGANRPSAIRYILENKESTATLSVEAEISQIFSWLIENPNDEDAWLSIHEYSQHTDAGITLSFLRDCHLAIRKAPSLFLDRYKKGDEQALYRMVDAFRHDPTSFGESIEEANQTLDACMKCLSQQIKARCHDKNQYKKIYYTMMIAEAQYKSWLARFKTKRPSKTVATTPH